MKSHHNKNKNHYKKLLLSLMLFLTACNDLEDKSTSAYLGQSTAKATKSEVHYIYLGCNALDSVAKKNA